MVQIHAVVGIVTLIVAVCLFIWNLVRIGRGATGPSFRMVLVGLMDLQILLGIITFILHASWGMWLLHPLFMLVAAAIGHVMLKESKAKRTQMLGYFLIPVLLILGVIVP